MRLFSGLVVVAAVAALLFAPPAAAKDLGSLDAGLAAAKKSGQPVLIDFYATWCGPCKAFTRASQEDADVQEALAGFNLVKYDAEKGEGIELAKRFSIKGYPTFVALNADGEVLDRWAGYSKESFLIRTQAVAEDPTTVAQKRARFEAGPNAKDAVILARIHDSKGENLEALKFFRKAAELGDDPFAFDIFYATFYGALEGDLPEQDLLDAVDTLFEHEAEPAKMLTAARMMWGYGQKMDKPELGKGYLKTAVERTRDTDDPEALSILEHALPIHALHVEGDADKAVALKRKSLGEGWKDNPSKLNSFAWWCFENRVNLEEAQALAERGAELAAPGADRAQILDTVAEICNAREDCSNAVAWMRRAVAEAPDNEYYKKQLARFEELLAQQQK